MKKKFFTASLAVTLLALPILAQSAYASTATSSDVGLTTSDIYFPSPSTSVTAAVTSSAPSSTSPSVDWGSVAHDVKTGIDIVGELNTAFQIVRFIGGFLG
jgi:hypothetical protein